MGKSKESVSGFSILGMIKEGGKGHMGESGNMDVDVARNVICV